MTGEDIFEKILEAMLARQRLSDADHMERYKRYWMRPHDLKFLLADCKDAFDKVEAV